MLEYSYKSSFARELQVMNQDVSQHDKFLDQNYFVWRCEGFSVKGTLMRTPNREPQEYSRNRIEYKDPGRYIPFMFLLYSCGSLFGVPSKVPLP